jgi:hypothetical protein
MFTRLTRLALVALVAAILGCYGSGTSGQPSPGTTTAPVTSVVAPPAPVTSAPPAPVPTATPASSWLFDLDGNTVTTFALDPVTGGPGSPATTSLGHLQATAGCVDPSSKTLFVGGSFVYSAPYQEEGQVVALDASTGTLVAGSTVVVTAQSSVPRSLVADPSLGQVLLSNGLARMFGGPPYFPPPAGAVPPIPAAITDVPGLYALGYSGTSVAPPQAASSAPGYLALDATAQVLYAAGDVPVGSSGSMPSISSFTVGAGGALTPVPGSPFGLPDEPVGIALHPKGSFLYAPHVDGTVDAFPVTNGAPGFRTRFTATTMTNLVAVTVAMDPLGRFLFHGACDQGNLLVATSTITALAIDPTTGALSPAGTITLPGELRSLAVNASGNILYVGLAPQGAGPGSEVAFLTVSAAGALTAMPGSPIALPNGSGGILVTSP